eukprot:g50279.t1
MEPPNFPPASQRPYAPFPFDIPCECGKVKCKVCSLGHYLCFFCGATSPFPDEVPTEWIEWSAGPDWQGD